MRHSTYCQRKLCFYKPCIGIKIVKTDYNFSRVQFIICKVFLRSLNHLFANRRDIFVERDEQYIDNFLANDSNIIIIK